MRVRFGDKIHLCTTVTHKQGSTLILFTTSNGIYTAKIYNSDIADKLYLQILTEGYCDVSLYENSN